MLFIRLDTVLSDIFNSKDIEVILLPFLLKSNTCFSSSVKGHSERKYSYSVRVKSNLFKGGHPFLRVALPLALPFFFLRILFLTIIFAIINISIISNIICNTIFCINICFITFKIILV